MDNKALCNQCPNCKSENIVVSKILVMHNSTEVYVLSLCPDCGEDWKRIYQFDRHEDIK